MEKTQATLALTPEERRRFDRDVWYAAVVSIPFLFVVIVALATDASSTRSWLYGAHVETPLNLRLTVMYGFYLVALSAAAVIVGIALARPVRWHALFRVPLAIAPFVLLVYATSTGLMYVGIIAGLILALSLVGLPLVPFLPAALCGLLFGFILGFSFTLISWRRNLKSGLGSFASLIKISSFSAIVFFALNFLIAIRAFDATHRLTGSGEWYAFVAMFLALVAIWGVLHCFAAFEFGQGPRALARSIIRQRLGWMAALALLLSPLAVSASKAMELRYVPPDTPVFGALVM
ncbi:MAG: hypothetical protein AAFY53_06605, partial [Pseudomonadota bacterium]